MTNIVDQIDNSCAAGLNFLISNCEKGLFPCSLSTSEDMTQSVMDASPEAATPLLVQDMVLRYQTECQLNSLVTPYILDHLDSRGHYPFFDDPDLLATDTDTTGFALSTLLSMSLIDRDSCMRVAADVIYSIDPISGILFVHFEPDEEENQFDHVAAVNTLCFMYMLGQENPLKPTEDWILSMLVSGKYLEGSRYYPLAEAFEFFLARACRLVPSMHDIFADPLSERLNQHVPTENALGLAMNMAARQLVGLSVDSHGRRLLEMQRADGSWPAHSIFKYGTMDVYIGSPSVTTTFALFALGIAAGRITECCEDG